MTSAPARPSTAKLEKYFAGRYVPSNYGVMCARAAIATHTSVRCRVCKGLGFRDLSPEELAQRAMRLDEEHRAIARAEKESQREAARLRLAALREQLADESVCDTCDGTGYTKPTRAHRGTAMDSMFTTVRCTACRGSGETRFPGDVSAERGDVCLRCGGTGYRVPISVREVGSSKHGLVPRREGDPGPNDMAAEAPDEGELLELAELSRALERVRETVGDVVAAAIAAYHGPDGDRWAGHLWGRASRTLVGAWPRGAPSARRAAAATSSPRST